MSKIYELLKNEKVEWKKLGDIGEFYGGLTGKKKNDFIDGNAKFISYKNVYKNPATKLDVVDMVKIHNDEKQHKLKYGDILFTGSSETPDECGMSSVINQVLSENIYLNSFCFFLRLSNENLLLPDFSKHLFRSENIRIQIGKTASGVTRFNVSKELMKKIKIPIPSLQTQDKIVKILDSFTELQTELQYELQARTKQYSYYRDILLSETYLNKISEKIDKLEKKRYEAANNVGVEWKNLEQITDIILGGTPDKTKNEYWHNGTIPWMSSGEVNKKIVYSTNNFITKKGYDNSSATLVPANSTVIALAGQGKTRGMVARIKIRLSTNQSLATLIPNEFLNNDYLYYYLEGQYQRLRNVSSGDGSRGGLNKEILKKFPIPLPSLAVQEYIVSILDKFDTLIHNLSEGLPKEIELRKKQYEYYREKLLNFPKEN